MNCYPREVIGLGYNENFSRAYFERDIPRSVLNAFLYKLMEADDEETKQAMMDQFAAEAEAKYPYRHKEDPNHKE